MRRQASPMTIASHETDKRLVLITGGAGFIGCNLADRLVAEGHSVLIFDNLSRHGVERNLHWLKDKHSDSIGFSRGDVTDAKAVAEAASRAKAIFHFAAQVAVTTSLDDPRHDFDVNVRGTLNVLEAARRKALPVIFASTNKVYGSIDDIPLVKLNDAWLPADIHLRERGVASERPLDFHTPYGCSKGAADQYVLDYARSFGVPTAVMRMSCIYGPHQMGTEDQGWVAHFLMAALAGKPISVFGDGCQVRDILYVTDAVNAYIAAWKNIGRIGTRRFNLGGGPKNAVSLLQLIAAIEELIHRPVETIFLEPRLGDQRYYVSDIKAVQKELDLTEPMPWRLGIAQLAQWLKAEHKVSRAGRTTFAEAGVAS
jgi:CDP-paratose 2-epimerase